MTTRKAPLAAALLAGLLITYIDTRPTWDDTGVTAVLLLAASGIFGFAWPVRPWVWALAVGAWIPLVAIVRRQDFGMLLVLVLSFAGAYGGMAIRKAFFAPRNR